MTEMANVPFDASRARSLLSGTSGLAAKREGVGHGRPDSVQAGARTRVAILPRGSFRIYVRDRKSYAVQR